MNIRQRVDRVLLRNLTLTHIPKVIKRRNMNKKKFYQSLTILSGVVATIVALIAILAGAIEKSWLVFGIVGGCSVLLVVLTIYFDAKE